MIWIELNINSKKRIRSAMDLETIVVSFAVSLVTAYVTSMLNIRAEFIKWKNNFPFEFAKAKSESQLKAGELAKQYAAGFLISTDKEKYVAFIPRDAAITVGRGSNNDMILNDMTVSRNHLMVISEGDSVFLRDLEPTNPTYLNGKRIETKTKVNTGDIIKIGETILKFNEI
jgi:pSer/pThr/pTyr-binding forkhead associated (FHA) protein